MRQRVSRRRIKRDPRDGDVPVAVGGSLRSRRLKERKIELVLEVGGVGRGRVGEGTVVQDHGLSSMPWLCRQQTRSRSFHFRLLVVVVRVKSRCWN